MNEDDRLRIGSKVIEALGAPVSEEAWVRSGYNDDEMKQKLRPLLTTTCNDENVIHKLLRDVMQLILLRSYLLELQLDNIISKGEVNGLLCKWVKNEN